MARGLSFEESLQHYCAWQVITVETVTVMRFVSSNCSISELRYYAWHIWSI